MQITDYMDSQLRATQTNVLFALGFLKHCKYLEGPSLPLGILRCSRVPGWKLIA